MKVWPIDKLLLTLSETTIFKVYDAPVVMTSMNEVYVQRASVEISSNWPHWPVKASDHVPTSTSAELFQREEVSTPGKIENTEYKVAPDRVNHSLRQFFHQHPQLELVPQRKRFKQCATGKGGPSTSKSPTSNFTKGNAIQKGKGGGGNGKNTGGAGSSKPLARDPAAGRGNANDNNDNNDDDDDDEFDPADEEIHKTVDTQCAQCDDGGFLI